jgi:starvation-inducible DNA-binding protein
MELVKSMRTVFANTFVMYFKAHAFHWNVEGILFSQYHDFFGKIYEEVYGSIDGIAEEIRTLGEYPPMSISEMYADKTTEEASSPMSIPMMLTSLEKTNAEIIEQLNRAFELASSENKQGLADFLAGRIDAHTKHKWMLTSSMK